MAPFQLIVQATNLGRIFLLGAFFAAFLAGFATICYKTLEIFSGHLNRFWDFTTTNWIQFIGYVCNFDLMYKIFVFYYVVFCTFAFSYIVYYSLDLSSRIMPELVASFHHFLLKLTGDK